LYLLKNRAGLDARGRELVNIAGAELGRMSRIVKQSLSYYRGGLASKDIDLGAMVAESLQVFSGKLQRGGIQLRRVIEEDAFVLGFPDEIRQVIDNLLLNAIEVMAAGGSLVVAVRRSRDWAGSRPGVRFTIADSGPGIPRDLLPRIFEPFFTTKAEKGTGLGLWVVRGIVAKHDGIIRVRSSARLGNSGTVVSVLWPTSSRAEKHQPLLAQSAA
jgi:signal transduction histidine kinase